MNEPDLAESLAIVGRLKRIVALGKRQVNAIETVLAAYEERVREIERLGADNASLSKLMEDQTVKALQAAGKWQQAEAKLAEAQAEVREVYDALSGPIPYVAVGQTPAGFRAREAARLLVQAEAREAKLREALSAARGCPGGELCGCHMIVIAALAASPEPGPTAEEAERCRKTPGRCTCGAHITELGDWPAPEPASPPPVCTGSGSTPIDAQTAYSTLPTEGRCGICGQVVPLMPSPTMVLAVHPYRTPEPAPQAQVIDLMEVLKASLAKRKSEVKP